MFKVNVAPDMGMYTLLRSQGYDPGYALAEFIDNSIHAYLAWCKKRRKAGDPLRVDLRFYSSECADSSLRNSIVITDDGPGITREVLPTALKPAHPPTELGLSEFGIGMKAASVWFTDTWELKTRPAGDTHEFVVPFDLKALLASGEDTVNVSSRTRLPKAVGTEISLRGLRRPLEHARYGDICLLLQSLYQRFTEGAMPQMELTAWFDGTPRSLKFIGDARAPLEAPIYRAVDKQVYAIGKARVWSETVDFEFMRHRVTGFLQVSEIGSYKDNPGLVMFRNDRVIKGTVSKPYSPNGLVGTANKYGRQRIYGELNLDGLPVTYTKDDFDFNEGAFVARLREVPGIEELLRQAETYRTKDQDKVIAVADDAALDAKLKRAGKTVRKPKPSPKPGDDAGNGAGSNGGTKGFVGDGGKGETTPTRTTKPTKNRSESPFVEVLARLREAAGHEILKSLIEEASRQYTQRRPLAAAMCFRAVLEVGFMYRLQVEFPMAYQQVASLGIKGALKKFNTRPGDIFEPGRDQRVIKCVQSIVGGQQLEVVVLNNISHGSYIPTCPELDGWVRNLEVLLDWSYRAGSYASPIESS